MLRCFCVCLVLFFAGVAYADAVPCVVVRDRMLIPLRLNHLGPYYFLVDGGLDTPVLNGAFVDAMGLATVSSEDIHFMEGPHFLAHGELRFEFDHLGVGDCSGIDAFLGREIAGIFPLYQPGYEVTVDMGAQEIAWVPLSADTLQPDGAGVLPLRVGDDRVPQIEVALGGDVKRSLPLDLQLSAGAALRASTLAKTGQGDAVVQLLLPDGGVLNRSQVPSLSLGGTKVRNLWCQLMAEDGEERLGVDVLKQGRLTLNYEAGLARFEGSSLPAIAATPPKHGIALGRYMRPYWSLAIQADSPATRAGLEAGDLLTQIQGVSMSGASYTAVAQALQAPWPQGLELHVRHKGTARRVVIPAE